MRTIKLAAIGLFIIISTSSAIAGGMRCGTEIVREHEDYEYQLLMKCGEPAFKTLNRWIYDRGPSQSILKVVHLVERRVTIIEELHK